jgi:exodeoxyribonuclease-3
VLIATWNINSIRMRIPRLQQWLENKRPDVLCLQETKVVDEDFPVEPLRALGYHCSFRGEKSYNGVAILSLAPPLDLESRLPDDGADAPCRFIAGTFGDIRIINIYAPNGSEVGSDKYAFKLEWYMRLRRYLDDRGDPDSQALMCGDFNIAPEDRDVWDPAKWSGQILCSEPERSAFRELIAWGFTDALRLLRPEEGLYTWWDYRGGAFHRGWGLRIDHVLVTRSLASRCRQVEIDREARKGEKPSDHAPVVATIGEM